jgi:hypothetical protein
MNEFRSCKQSVVLAKLVPDCWRCMFQSAAYRILLSSGPLFCNSPSGFTGLAVCDLSRGVG